MSSIVPFVVLIISDSILIYIVVFSTQRNSAQRQSQKKLNMSRTIVILNISFILLTLPSAIISGYFYLILSQSDIGYLVLITCDNLTFSFHSFNLINLFIFNSKFRSELRLIFSRIRFLNQVDSVSYLI